MSDNNQNEGPNASEQPATAPNPVAELVGAGVPAAEAGNERCGACSRALPHRERTRGGQREYCLPEHTQWRVPDHKGGTKLMKCRDVAAAWTLEADTRGRADAPGPPIDLLGLQEQVVAWQALATQVLVPAQALIERAAEIQEALAGDVAAARRAADAAVADVRDMRGQVEVANAATAAAREQARLDRDTAARETAAADAARRDQAAALAARDHATGALEKEAERRADAETKRDAAVEAREHAETENYALAATITEQRERITGLETAATETTTRHHEEIGRLHSEHSTALAAALATARLEHEQALTEQLAAERTRLADELTRATTAHTAELARLAAELETIRTGAATAADTHTTAIGRLNRDLGAASTAAAAAEARATEAITAVTAAETRATEAADAWRRLRTELTGLLVEPADDLHDRLVRLLADDESGSDR